MGWEAGWGRVEWDGVGWGGMGRGGWGGREEAKTTPRDTP